MQNTVPSPSPGPHPAAGPAGGQQWGEGQRSLALRFQIWAGLLLLGHFDQRAFNPFMPALLLGKASLSEGGKRYTSIQTEGSNLFLATSPQEKETYNTEERVHYRPNQKVFLKFYFLSFSFGERRRFIKYDCGTTGPLWGE